MSKAVKKNRIQAVEIRSSGGKIVFHRADACGYNSNTYDGFAHAQLLQNALANEDYVADSPILVSTGVMLKYWKRWPMERS